MSRSPARVGRTMVRAAALVLLAAGCGAIKPKASGPAPQDPGKAVVYVAVGASESVGAGAQDPVNEAWPQVFFRRSLPLGAVFENDAAPGATAADALGRQVPDAVAQAPTLATVWLDVNDIVRSVPVATFEPQLDQVVSRLRRGGATKVLVANVPPLDHLPAFLACLPGAAPGSVPCGAGRIPSVDALDSVVDAYNAAIARVADKEGAVLVDLHAAGLAARADGTEPADVAADGFHPSTAGHAAIAAAFGQALVTSGGP